MTPEIIAHRGASYLAPENTLSAFRKAMEIGADGVEMDVQQTSDKKLVIHHDFVIDWHTDMRGQIYDMTPRRVLSCAGKYPFCVPQGDGDRRGRRGNGRTADQR